MVDPLVGKQSQFVESIRQMLFLAPVDIPIVIVALLVAPFEETGGDAVGEVSFELDL